MSDREATSEMSSSVRGGAATTRSIHLGMNSRKVPLGPLKGNLLPIPLMRKTRTRKMRKGRGMRKMTRAMRMNGGGEGVRMRKTKMRGTSLEEERQWVVNEFYQTMSSKVFNTLRDRYQISENIPLRLPGKFEKCYSRRTVNIGMYNAMFVVGLRLSLTDLYR